LSTYHDCPPCVRAWPLPRDIRGLITGGLCARAALNRHRSTVANLREAVLVGVTAYFAFSVVGIAGFLLASVGEPRFAPFDWLQVLGAVLTLATAVTAWAGARRAVVLIFAIPAAGAVVLAGPWQFSLFGSAVTELACLAVLVALGDGEPPNPRWLRPIGAVVFALLIPVSSSERATLLVICLLSLVIASIVWLAVDGRPMIAFAVFLLALSLPTTIDEFGAGMVSPVGVRVLGISGAIAALAVWRLRHQSAHPGRPTQT